MCLISTNTVRPLHGKLKDRLTSSWREPVGTEPAKHYHMDLKAREGFPVPTPRQDFSYLPDAGFWPARWVEFSGVCLSAVQAESSTERPSSQEDW